MNRTSKPARRSLLPRSVLAPLACAIALRAGHAAECEPSYLREAAHSAELIFAGTVLRIEWTRATPPEPARSAPNFAEAVTFAVDQTWRGETSEEIEIYSSRRADCRRSFDAGQRYLVYADRRPEDGRLVTTCCSRGGPIPEVPRSPPGAHPDQGGQDQTLPARAALDRLYSKSPPRASTADADEIRALWDRYLAALKSGAADVAAAQQCPEMTALFERWRDLVLAFRMNLFPNISG